MKQMLIFGLGYTAGRVADALKARGWAIDATGSQGNLEFDDEHAVRAALREASHVLSSVPPDRAAGEDPVLARYGDALAGQWIGYLSSTGVYGDQQGAWVDESTPTIAESSEGRRHGGTGLGLPLARSLTELNGGRLGIDSLPGRGTTVWLHFPADSVLAGPVSAERSLATA